MANSNLATRGRPSLQHVPIQGTWGISSKNKGVSQWSTYCLISQPLYHCQGSSANGLKGRCSSRGIPGGNGEKVAESSAFVDSLRKCNERMEDYECSALLLKGKMAFSDEFQAQYGGGRGFDSPRLHQPTPDPHLTERGSQSQAQCGDFLHRRPYPDPRLTDEVGTQTPAAVTQLNSEPRQSESESLVLPNRIAPPPSNQWVVFTSPAVSRAAASNAQTTSLTRSPAPRTSVNRKPAKRLVVGIHRPANPPSAQNHDQQVRFPQVNDLNPQHPESQSGAQPLVIGDDQSLTDTHLYKERRPVGSTAVRTRSQRSRRWILAASGAELRRLATRKQIRLAYFHARSGCTWSFWDNIKIKEQPEVAKSLWLAGFLAGFDAKTIDKAFDDALHESHGMATDVGLNEGNPRLKFEMSHTVSLAKEILIRKLEKPDNSKN